MTGPRTISGYPGSMDMYVVNENIVYPLTFLIKAHDIKGKTAMQWNLFHILMTKYRDFPSDIEPVKNICAFITIKQFVLSLLHVRLNYGVTQTKLGRPL